MSEEIKEQNIEDQVNNAIEEALDGQLESEENKKEKKKNSLKKTRIEQDLENLNYSAKDLMTLPENLEFKHTVQKVVEHLSKMSFLDEVEVQQEINKFAEKTAFAMNKDVVDIKEYLRLLDNIQVAKDRISALYQQALSQNNFVETLYLNLFKVWTGKFSKLSSDKRREGEAELILSWMWYTKIERKNVVTSLKTFHDNLNSKSDIVSRKITIHQEANRILGSYSQYSPEQLEALEDIEEGGRRGARGKVGWGDIKR